MYQGIWLECGPHEGALYGEYDPQIARNNHEIFWDLAREDGFIPPFIRETPGDGQLQTVVPLGTNGAGMRAKAGAGIAARARIRGLRALRRLAGPIPR